MDHKFKLGEEVKDMVTERKGLAVSRIEYLNGCWQYGVVFRDKKNAGNETTYIDHGQLVRVSAGISADVNQKDTGGPQRHAPNR